MDLASLVRKSRTISVDFQGERLVVKYAPNKLDAHLYQKLQDSEKQGLESVIETLQLLLTEWDMEWDGEPMPLNQESMMRLPLNLLLDVGKLVMEDFDPGKQPAPLPAGS